MAGSSSTNKILFFSAAKIFGLVAGADAGDIEFIIYILSLRKWFSTSLKTFKREPCQFQRPFVSRLLWVICELNSNIWRPDG